MHELPANHCPLALIGNAEQLQLANDFLTSKGYTVKESQLADDAFWQRAAKQNILQQGQHSVTLWRANPLLVNIIDQVEQHIPGRTMIDLACGAGRDSVYLAQRGWQVTSIDNKLDTLERCQQLAKSNQAELTTLLRDLEKETEPLADLSADLVLVMRYLHRPLFDTLLLIKLL